LEKIDFDSLLQSVLAQYFISKFLQIYNFWKRSFISFMYPAFLNFLKMSSLKLMTGRKILNQAYLNSCLNCHLHSQKNLQCPRKYGLSCKYFRSQFVNFRSFWAIWDSFWDAKALCHSCHLHNWVLECRFIDEMQMSKSYCQL
jgi:hypothetical protein